MIGDANMKAPVSGRVRIASLCHLFTVARLESLPNAISTRTG